MLSTILFISGGEIFVILLAILIFFGADKIPEFARMMGKGVREFKKATDDIKREFSENTSGVMDDIKSIGNDLSDTLTKEVSEPMEQTANETASAFDEYAQDPYNSDYYYNNQDYNTEYGNEYQTETKPDAEPGASQEPATVSDNNASTEVSEKPAQEPGEEPKPAEA